MSQKLDAGVTTEFVGMSPLLPLFTKVGPRKLRFILTKNVHLFLFKGTIIY